MSFFEVITDLMPVLAVLLFLVIFRFPAVIAMPISFVIVAVLSLIVWKVPILHVVAATLEGGIIPTKVSKLTLTE